MQYFACDLCSGPCSGTTTRRWESINGDIGLEVVVLRGDKPVGDIHICESCILTMFYKMLERHPNTGIRMLQNKLKIKEIDLDRREQELKVLENSLRVLTKQLEVRERGFNDIQARMEQSRDFNLMVQMEEWKRREAEIVRLAEARGKQQAIDNEVAKLRRY